MSLTLSAVEVELGLFDRLAVDTLAFGVFVEDRPLKGTAGFCDWRLNGRLSALLLDGVFGCRPEETLLTDTNRRIRPGRLLLFGLGERAALDQAALRRVVRHMLVVAKKARVESLGLELPGLAGGLVEPEAAVRALLEVAAKAYPDGRIVLLCPDRKVAQKASELAASEEDVRLAAPTAAD